MDMTTQPPATREKIDLPGGSYFEQGGYSPDRFFLHRPDGTVWQRYGHGYFVEDEARAFAAAMAPPSDPASRATARAEVKRDMLKVASKPWDLMGISRSAYFAQRKRAAVHAPADQEETA